MQQTNLGELTVSAQALGCMGMSEGYGRGTQSVASRRVRA